jgi:MtN3 and saliva related transmembrane protein
MFAFIPQIFKVVKTKSVGDVSVMTLGQLSAGVTLWVVYGIARRDPIIILANTVTLTTLCVLFWLYTKYK